MTNAIEQPTPQKIVEVLTQVRDIIAAQDHVPVGQYRDKHDCYCITGALLHIIDVDYVMTKTVVMMKAMEPYLKPMLPHINDPRSTHKYINDYDRFKMVTYYSDTHTKSQVDDMLNKAIATAKEAL